MGTETKGADESVQLAYFPRRSKDTGNDEQIRVTVAEWNGKILVSCRVWFRVKSAGPDDDGWRPSKQGFTIREHEIDIWAGALEKVRVMLAEKPGRRTREARRDQPPTRRGPWQPAPHTRSEVYRLEAPPGRLAKPGAAGFDEFDEGGADRG